MSRAGLKVFCALGLVALLAACAGSGGRPMPAPVEDRMSRGQGAVPSTMAAPRAMPDKPLPGAENAGKPGYYTVKPGDTLIEANETFQVLLRNSSSYLAITSGVATAIPERTAAVDTFSVRGFTGRCAPERWNRAP